MDYAGTGIYGLQPPTWVSGKVIAQRALVTSPIDNEVYRRITASGSGSIDPADDTTNYVAVSYLRVTSLPIPNSLTLPTNTAANFANGAVKVLPGLISADTRTQLLSVTGRGAITYLSFMKANTGGGRFELIVDGRVLFDASIQTNATDANIFIGAAGVGVTAGPAYHLAYYAIPEAGVQFRRSVSVYYTPANSSTSTQTVLAHIIRSVQ